MSKIEVISSILAFTGGQLYLHRLKNTNESPLEVSFKKNSSQKLAGPENYLVDCLAFSPCGKNVALCFQKEILLYEITGNDCQFANSAPIEKKAVSVKFFNRSKAILVAEKCGLVAFYTYDSGILAKQPISLGHNSMLTDALITPEDNFVITADRDEKIRVSHYPNTYNIQSYCLGHQQFVSSLQFLPSDGAVLISASGDGTVRLWDFTQGKQLAVYKESKEEPLMKCVCFCKDGGDVVAVQKYKSSDILLLSVTGATCNFDVKVKKIISAVSHILDMCVFDSKLLYLLDDDTPIRAIEVLEPADEECLARVNCSLSKVAKLSPTQKFDVLFKKEFSNVEVYHERKRARLAEKIK